MPVRRVSVAVFMVMGCDGQGGDSEGCGHTGRQFDVTLGGVFVEGFGQAARALEHFGGKAGTTIGHFEQQHLVFAGSPDTDPLG